MRKWFWVGMAILFACALGANAQQTVTLNWKQPTTQAWTNCVSGGKVTCLDHMTVFDVTSGAPGNIVSDNIAVTALTTSFTGPAANFVTNRLYDVEFAYYDMNGTLNYSAPATCGSTNTAAPCSIGPFTITPPAIPTGVTGTVK